MSDQHPETGVTATSTPPATRSRRAWLVLGGLVVIAATVLLVVWYVGRDTPAAVDTQAAVDAAAADGTGTDAADDDGGSDVGDDTDDGARSSEGVEVPTEWEVDTGLVAYDFAAGTGTFLGFRIDEELSTVGATTAVGRTPAVDGGLTLEATTPEATTLSTTTVTGDLTALTTDISQRDSRAQRAMNTAEFPTTTFELTAPIELGAPVVGETIAVEAAGELTLSGVTQPVTATMEAVLLDRAEQLLVTGTFEVLLADFGIEAPSASIVVSVADTATIEFQLYLTPG